MKSSLSLGGIFNISAVRNKGDSSVDVGSAIKDIGIFQLFDGFCVGMTIAVICPTGDDCVLRRSRFEVLCAGGSAAAVVSHGHHINIQVHAGFQNFLLHRFLCIAAEQEGAFAEVDSADQ